MSRYNAAMVTLERYLPSLDRARQETLFSAVESDHLALPPGPPRSEHKLVALVVGVSGQRRRRGMLESIRTVDLYLPNVLSVVPELFALEPTLETSMCGVGQPECLRCHDLRPIRVGGGPYRASERERLPEFHGFSFGNTIELAIEGLQRTLIGVEPNSYSIAAYARPLLWLDYGPGAPHNQRVLYTDDNGTLFTFVGTPPSDD